MNLPCDLKELKSVIMALWLLLIPLQIPAPDACASENNTITAIRGICVGHYTDTENLKGCTVVRFGPDGATAAVSVQGSAPGTRETDLLDPVNLVDRVHAVLLSGGSAYGLDAASGVMACLEGESIGFPVGKGVVVPIVPGAVLFDLHMGNPNVRPSAQWGRLACQNATHLPVETGNVGAGTNTTIGIVAANIPLTKTQLKKVAQMAHDGLARVISPVHTMYDGDTVFAVSVPARKGVPKTAPADLANLAGTAAAEAMADAIVNAVNRAVSVTGCPAASDWNR